VSIVEEEVVAPPRTPEGGPFFEVVDGVEKEVSPMGFFAVMIASRLHEHLAPFATRHGLGIVVVEGLFNLPLPRDRRRRPDVAFVSYDRLPTEWSETPTGDPPALDAAPNLAVEVVSPTDLADELEEKLTDYFEAGAQAAWTVYPRWRQVYVYDARTQVRLLTQNDTLDGGAFLPGFSLPVAALFTPPVRPGGQAP
jgi:Uma2 family endonuclease